MFIHNLNYSLKTLLKNKILIFWTFAFPIILGTFFKMAFSNIENSEKLDIIDIAIIENDEFKNSDVFKESFKTLSDESNKDRLFNTKYVDEEKAKEMLKNDEITGYLILEDEPKIIVNTSGINETILNYVVEEIAQSETIMQNIAQKKIQDAISGTIQFNSYDVLYDNIYNEVTNIIKENSYGLFIWWNTWNGCNKSESAKYE